MSGDGSGPSSAPSGGDAEIVQALQEALAREVAARKCAESDLRRAEQRLESLLETGSDWLWETGPDHRFTMFSGRPETSGPSPQSMVGMTRYELAADKDDEPKWREHLETLERHGAFTNFVYVAGHPERGLRHVRVSGEPMFTSDGSFIGHRGIATDITDAVVTRLRLEETSEILQSIFDNMEQGVAVFGPGHRLLVGNGRFAALLEVPEGAAVSRGAVYSDVLRSAAAFMLLERDDMAEALVQHLEAVSGGSASRFELALPSGTWLQVNANPLAGGGFVITVTDVTPLKLAVARQRELRRDAARTRRQLREALESMSEGFVLYDSEDRLVMFNQRYRDEFSFAPEAMVPGTPYEEILRQGAASNRIPRGYDAERWIAERLEAHRNPPPPHLVERGDGRWTLMREYRTKEGGIVGIRTDVTELKVRERAAEASERLLRSVIDAVPASIQTKDRELRYRLANRYFLQSWNLRLEHVVGRTQEEVFRDGLEDAYGPDATRRDHEVLRTRRATGFYEVSYPRADGTVLTLWANKLPMLDENGDVFRIVSVGIDISELKRAQEEIAKQREALHQSEKLTALGSLLAGVAHELNNPLSIVVGRAMMLEESTTDPALAERIGKIREAAERCGRIVRTFLAMARQRAPEWQPVRINTVVRDALELVAYNLRSGGVELVMDLETDLPIVSGDPDELTQVMMNLLVNSEQALSESDRDRRIVVRTCSEGDKVVVEVGDNGPGIPEGVRHRVFEPFFTTKPTGSGTGIGLSVCRGIVLAHGGDIEIEPGEGGVGSKFIIRLPAGIPSSRDEEPDNPEPAPPVSLPVLVVDDEPEITELVAEILERSGHRVDVAHGGRTALRALERKHYRVIISDLRMPDMDGRALFEQSEQVRPGSKDRFLFLTGDTLSPMARRFLAEAGRPHLAKPVVPSELRRAVAEVIASGDAAWSA